jgi:hypothetical protein
MISTCERRIANWVAIIIPIQQEHYARRVCRFVKQKNQLSELVFLSVHLFDNRTIRATVFNSLSYLVSRSGYQGSYFRQEQRRQFQLGHK